MFWTGCGDGADERGSCGSLRQRCVSHVAGVCIPSRAFPPRVFNGICAALCHGCTHEAVCRMHARVVCSTLPPFAAGCTCNGLWVVKEEAVPLPLILVMRPDLSAIPSCGHCARRCQSRLTLKDKLSRLCSKSSHKRSPRVVSVADCNSACVRVPACGAEIVPSIAPRSFSANCNPRCPFVLVTGQAGSFLSGHHHVLSPVFFFDRRQGVRAWACRATEVLEWCGSP